MSTEFAIRAKRCCSIEHDRLVGEIENCDKFAHNPSKWHQCARVASRKSSTRAKACMLRK